MKQIILFFAGIAFFTSKNVAQTVTDYDGNVYHTITIGTQTWLKENLKASHYRNGDAILNITDGVTWSSFVLGAYCFYNNISNNDSVYGKLYNWYAVSDIRNITPVGWHVPSDAEWTILINTLGGESVAGGKLKEADTLHWCSPNFNATNMYDFTAFSGGSRKWDGGFQYLCYEGYWWSSTEIDSSNANCRSLFNDGEFVQSISLNKLTGSSVRCIKDAATSIDYNNNYDKLQIYPNPSIDRIFINCNEGEVVKLQIYNMIGMCILQNEFINGIKEIDISSLSKGIYMIKLNGANWAVNRKMTKL